MKKVVIIFILFLSNSFFSQEFDDKIYIKLSDFKNLFPSKKIALNSDNLRVLHGDTLILINKKKLSAKGADSLNYFKKAQRTRAYIPINQYKKKYQLKITKEDSLNFIYKDNDTLILISNKSFYKPNNSVKVPYEPKDSIFLETYKDVVYRKSSLKAGENKEFMKLWKEPIKIYFDSSLDVFYKETILNAAKYITDNIDSLQISEIKDIDKANYIVYQIDENNTKKLSENIVRNQYIDYYMFWKKGQIYDVKLEVNLLKYSKLPKEIHANYVLQYFYKTLGRFYSTDKLGCYSMFSKCNKNDKILTHLDLEILKYHYSYGICKFTDLETFEENHKKAIEELKKGNKMYFIHSY